MLKILQQDKINILFLNFIDNVYERNIKCKEFTITQRDAEMKIRRIKISQNLLF